MAAKEREFESIATEVKNNALEALEKEQLMISTKRFNPIDPDRDRLAVLRGLIIRDYHEKPTDHTIGMLLRSTKSFKAILDKYTVWQTIKNLTPEQVLRLRMDLLNSPSPAVTQELRRQLDGSRNLRQEADRQKLESTLSQIDKMSRPQLDEFDKRLNAEFLTLRVEGLRSPEQVMPRMKEILTLLEAIKKRVKGGGRRKRSKKQRKKRKFWSYKI